MKSLRAFTWIVLLHAALAGSLFAQWEPTNGPLSQTPVIRSIVTLGSEYLVQASAQDGSLSGLFRSTDKGLTWDYFSSSHAQGLLFVNGSTILSYEQTRYTSGLFRSTDKGMTWESATIDLGTAYISCFCALGGYLYAGTYWNSGVYRSSDDGKTWTGDGNSVSVFGLLAHNGQILAGTWNNGILRSTDFGTSWKSVFPSIRLSGRTLCLSGTTIFALGSGGSDGSDFVYRSTDDGITWAQSIKVPYPPGSYHIGAVDGVVVIDLSGQGVLRSTDNGFTWVAADSGLTNFYVNEFASNGQDLFLSSEYGLFRSTDLGARWSLLGIPLGRASINAVAAQGSNIYAGSTSAELFRSTDNGVTWNMLSAQWPVTLPHEGWPVSDPPPPPWGVSFGGDSKIRALAPVGNKIFFAMGRSGVISSSDDGVSWRESNAGLTDHEIRTLYVSGSTVFAGAIHGGAFRSTDYGEHWAPVNVGITDTTVLAFARDRHGPSLYAGTANKGVFVSTNDGDTWRPIDGVLGNTRIGSLFADGGLLLAGCGDAEWYSVENGGIFRSSDYGASWVLSDAISRTVGVGGISIDSSGKLLALALGKAGVYYSTDAGMSWFDCNSGLAGRNSLGIAFGDSFAFSAGIPGGVVYRRPTYPLSLFTSVEPSPASVPASFSLSQNYPNPFNPSTRIKYTVGGAGEAGAGGSGLGARKTMLVVYDLLGREVAVLVNEPKAPGSYEVDFDAGGLASGIYFYRLQSGSQSLSRKMVILR